MIKSSYNKVLPSYLLLIFMPCLFGLLFYYFILCIDKNHEIDNIKSHLSEKASDFMAKSTAVDYFKPHFDNLYKNILPIIAYRKRYPKYQEDITKVISSFNNNLNEDLRCAVFDRNCNLLNPNNLYDYESRFFTYAWKKIHRITNTNYEKKSEDQYQIIGRDFNDELLTDRSEACIPVSSLGKSGVLYFKNANFGTNGILVYVVYKKTNIELIEARIKDFATKENPILLFDIKNEKCRTPEFNFYNLPYSKTETDEFIKGYIEDNKVWKGFITEDYKLLFGQPLNRNKYFKKFLIAIVIDFLIFIIASAFFFKNLSNNRGIFISIRYKLVFIFALAIYLPTIFLWTLSYISLDDYRLAIENKTQKSILDILNKIDLGYKKNEENIKNMYLELDNYLKNFIVKKEPTSSEVKQKLQEIVGLNNSLNETFNWIDIRNIAQKQIYTSHDKKDHDKFTQMSRVISLLCLEKYCPERLHYAGIKPNKTDIFVGNILENPIVGFSSLFQRPRELVSLNFEGVEIYWWWNYFSDPSNPVAFYMCNASTKFVNIKYLNSIKTNRYTLDNVNLKIISYIYESQSFIPEISNNKKELLDIINVSHINNKVESAQMNYDGKRDLVLCVPGSHLKECYLLGLYPISYIDNKINDLRSDIYTLIIILLIVSVLTGSLLARSFILPVNELNKGLKALTNRETEITVSIENRDELGDLGNAFNQMMIEIKDLLLAGAVQQCLIPTGKYKIEGYECFVYNRMADDLGGDYADIFELPEDKLLIVIGDVTGHGISSSLLTTMVKASIFRFAQKNLILDELITKISDMIYELLKKKKLMTFTAISLDKATGEINICNAGHPFPIIKEKTPGKYRIPTQTSLPMGASKRRCKYTLEKEILNPEETLIMYTDGFPEAENTEGKEYGYERFKDFVSKTKINSAEDLKNQLLEEFGRYHGEASLTDDLTFIVLRRKPLQDD